MAPPRLLFHVCLFVSTCFTASSITSAQDSVGDSLGLKLFAEVPRDMPRWVMASAFSPDGSTLALPIDDTGELGIYSVDLTPPPPPKDLTEEDKEEVDQMIKDLGSDTFAKRQAATRALREMGSLAEPQIHAALETPSTTEEAMRIRQLLDQIAQSSRGGPARMAKELHSLSIADDSIRALEFTKDGSKLLVASPGLLSVLDTKTWKEIHRVVTDSWIGVDAVWLPGDNEIALAIDTEVHIYSAKTGERESTFPALTNNILSLDVSPDGKFLACSGQGTSIAIWNLKKSERLHHIDGFGDYVGDIKFSPDGKHVATASEDGSVRLWDVESGKRLFDMRDHRGEVWCLHFSPDGKSLVSGAERGGMIVCDAKTGRVLARDEERTFYGRHVEFTKDSKYLLSATSRGKGRIWRLNFTP